MKRIASLDIVAFSAFVRWAAIWGITHTYVQVGPYHVIWARRPHVLGARILARTAQLWAHGVRVWRIGKYWTMRLGVG